MKLRQSMSFVLAKVRVCIFVVLEYMLTKKENYWSFCAWGRHYHTLDNPRAVFERVKNDADIKKIVLVKKDQRQDIIEGRNVVFVDADSLLGLFYVARSKVILLAYSLSGLSNYSDHITTRHLIIQLWHGIPLKKIGKLFPGEEFWDGETYKYSAVICSSHKDKEVMAAAFAPIRPENVWVCGLPRNEIIMMDENRLPKDYKDRLTELKSAIGDKRFVLYAPTWRYDYENIYEYSDAETQQLDELLSKHNAILGVRGHGNVRSASAYNKDHQSSSIISANDYPDVNVVLRLTDILITDYSSIYIDFLITGRPILHFTYDLDSYVNERGFLYSLEDAFAGPGFATFDELLVQLGNLLSGNESGVAKQYHTAYKLFHSHGTEPAMDVVKKVKSIATRS